jgi:antitoxin Phd
VQVSQTSHMPKAFKKPKRGVTSSARFTRRSWTIQSAKANFSEVFRLARTEGPQHITCQGKEGVVMISEEQYDLLLVKSYQPKSIVRFFRESPLVGADLDLTRDKDTGHDTAL